MKITKKTIMLFVLLGALIMMTLTACGHDNFKDVKNVPNKHPDYLVNYENVDRHPNMMMICIHGAGFVTTTREGAGALHLVPEWDAFCKAHEIKGQ